MKLITKEEELKYLSEKIVGLQFSLRDKDSVKNEARVEIK